MKSWNEIRKHATVAAFGQAMLYDPLKMPPDLLKQHQHLDALVDKLYGRKFASEAEKKVIGTSAILDRPSCMMDGLTITLMLCNV